MKKIIWLCCIVSIGIFLAPSSSFSALGHITNSVLRFECSDCHPDGPSAGYTPCIDCHDNSYTIGVETHSSEWTSEKYGVWERECVDCHNPHHSNGITVDDGITDSSFALVDLTVNYALTNVAEQTTTFQTVESMTVNDSSWADPADWGTKTSSERGLLFVWYNPTLGKYYWYEVISTTDDGNGNATSITIANYATYFTWRNRPINAQLVYGMLIQDELGIYPVKFGVPADMANNDGLGAGGSDSTPNGICQVCHTQTKYWRNDGLVSVGPSTDHHSGANCTECHPHELGFDAPPHN